MTEKGGGGEPAPLSGGKSAAGQARVPAPRGNGLSYVWTLCRVTSALGLQFFARRIGARGSGVRLRGTGHSGHGAARPGRRVRRAAFSPGGEKDGDALAHRLRNYLYQRPTLSAAMRKSRGLSEPLPAG